MAVAATRPSSRDASATAIAQAALPPWAFSTKTADAGRRGRGEQVRRTSWNVATPSESVPPNGR